MKLFAITRDGEIELAAGKASTLPGDAELQLRWDDVKNGWVVRVKTGGRLFPNKKVNGANCVALGTASELQGELSITAMDAMGGSDERATWSITATGGMTTRDDTKKPDDDPPKKPDDDPPKKPDDDPPKKSDDKKKPGGRKPFRPTPPSDELERLERENKALLERKAALEAENAALTREADELSVRNADLSSNVKKAQDQKRALEKQLGDARADVKAAKLELDDIDSELTAARDAIEKSKAELEEARNQSVILSDQVEQIRKKLVELQNSHATEEEALEKLKQLRDSKGLRDGEIAQATADLEAAEALLTSLTQKNAEVSGEITAAETSQNEMLTRRAELTDGNAALRAKVDQLEADRQLLEAQADTNLAALKKRLTEIFDTLERVVVISRDTDTNIAIARQALQADAFEEMKGEARDLLKQVEDCATRMTAISDRIAAVINARYDGNTRTTDDKRRKG